MRELSAATMGYRAILKNSNLCTHYYMECRDIKIKGLVSIGLKFYKHFLNATKDVRGKDFKRELTFKMQVTLRLVQKIIGMVRRSLLK